MMPGLEKSFIIVCLVLFLACNSGQTQQEKPQKVPRIVYEVYPNEWYQKQARLWKKEIDKNSKNAEAWHNYYNANRYANFENLDTKEKSDRLKKIIEDMGKAIPGTYEYYYLKFKNEHFQQPIDLVEKAHELRPDEPEPYYDLIVHNEFEGNEEKVREYYQGLYKTKDIAPWLLNYNYNVLMSTEKNAIIFTNGDNDTYPPRMLQEAKGIREDVTILNISMSGNQSYLQRQLKSKGIEFDMSNFKTTYINRDAQRLSQRFMKAKLMKDICVLISEKYPEIPVYIAFTIYSGYFEGIKDSLYIVGLAYKYSPNRIDNVAISRKNLERKFRLDHLSYDWYSEQVIGQRLMSRMYMNYFPVFVMLAEHYKSSEEQDKMTKWVTLAENIAQRADNSEALESLKEKF